MSSQQDSLREALHAASGLALQYIEALDQKPIAAQDTADALRARLDAPMPAHGSDPVEVLHDLSAAVQGGLHSIASGRFFGWVNGGSVPAALGADWLTSAWDQNASLFAVGPAASIVEEIVGTWLKDVLRLPASASFALVTGCQMAHTTCLAAARHRLLADRGWDVEQDGMSGAPAIRALTSTEAHGSALRAIRFLGIGESHIQRLACTSDGRLSPDALAAALNHAPATPTIVLLQAGDLNIGAFDDFEQLIPLAHARNAWVHIDGAFGLWAGASPRFAHLLRGADTADSWATDGHKWLNVPYDCGYAFVADPAAHRAAFSHAAPYIQSEGGRNAIDWTPEWSRRARGFSTYAALRELGKDGVADLIDRSCAHAHALVIRLGALPGAELVAEPQINQGLVRFRDPRPDARPTDHDAFTDQVTRGILADGQALFSNTTWKGRRAMRISVCNWQTSASDVDRVVESVARVLEQARSATLASSPSLA